MGTDPFCEMCSTAAIETTDHVFFHCPALSQLWKSEPFNVMHDVPGSNFASGISWLKENLEKSTFELACVVCWNLWNLRNSFMHGSEWEEKEELVARNSRFLHSFSSAQLHFPIQSSSLLPNSWPPHSCPFVED